MRKAVIYARFSSDKQTEMSIEAQVRACKEYALRTDLQITKIYADEAISGKSTLKRAEYQKMMKDAKVHKFDVILIHKYDRIARNLGDHVNLENKLREYEIQLIATAQDFGQGKEAKMMRGIQWLMSEYYVDNLTEEVKKGHKELAYKGKHNGGVAPFGYNIVDQKYVVNETEAFYVRKMYECCKAMKGYKDLIAEMNEQGIVGKRGKPFKYSSIYEILRNEKYSGVYVYSPDEEKERVKRRTKPNAIRVENAIPPIIDREEWLKVQEVLDSRKGIGVTKKTYKCSGIVFCGECGSTMHIGISQNKGHKYRYYRCPNKECPTKGVRTEIVDKVLDQFCAEYRKPEMVDGFAKLLKKYNNEQKTLHEQFESVRQQKLETKQAELDNLISNFTKGVMPKEVMDMLSDKMQELRLEIDTIKNAEEPKDFSAQLISDWFNKVLSAEEVELPNVLVEKIVIKNNSATVVSTLNELLVGKIGCGDTHPSLYATFKAYIFKEYCLYDYIVS